MRPLAAGVDYVLHSATKYLGGHNDLLAGVIIGSTEKLEPVRKLRGIMGAINSPHNIYLLQRGLKTFELRMQRHNDNGLAVAQFLASHPRVEKVYYPGPGDASVLRSGPPHDARLRRPGHVPGEGRRLAANGRRGRRVKIPQIGPSLGGVESLIEQPLVMSYYECTPEDRRRFGISDNMIRLACGIENSEDLIADLAPSVGAEHERRSQLAVPHPGHSRRPGEGSANGGRRAADSCGQHVRAAGRGQWGEFDYSRSGNPTRQGFETTLASLEGGVGALAFSSGMAATHCVTMLLDQRRPRRRRRRYLRRHLSPAAQDLQPHAAST